MENNIEHKTIESAVADYEIKVKEAYAVLSDLLEARKKLVSEIGGEDYNKLLEQFDAIFIRLFPQRLAPENMTHPNPEMEQSLEEMKDRYSAPDFNANLEEKLSLLNKNIDLHQEKSKLK